MSKNKTRTHFYQELSKMFKVYEGPNKIYGKDLAYMVIVLGILIPLYCWGVFKLLFLLIAVLAT